jgi:hypothetical protein
MAPAGGVEVARTPVRNPREMIESFMMLIQPGAEIIKVRKGPLPGTIKRRLDNVYFRLESTYGRANESSEKRSLTELDGTCGEETMEDYVLKSSTELIHNEPRRVSNLKFLLAD